MRSGRLSRSAPSQVSKSVLGSLLKFREEDWIDGLYGRTDCSRQSLLSYYSVVSYLGRLTFPSAVSSAWHDCELKIRTNYTNYDIH